MSQTGTVYLIPSVLDEQGYAAIPHATLDAIFSCQVFFVENERTARRYIMQLLRLHVNETRSFVIDDHEWHTIHKAEEKVRELFLQKLREGRNIGILSEAGCPAIADPGQQLVEAAQQMKVTVKPLTGPNSILLALMASGMNGQQFRFSGYLPIDSQERARSLKELESESAAKNCTQIFIETPYRNNQLIESILKNCMLTTRLCLAANLTGEDEWVVTKRISEWKNQPPDLHKRPVIFLLMAG